MKCEKWTDQHDTGVGQWKNLSKESNPLPPGVREVMGSIPYPDFFFVPRSCHADQFTFHIQCS